MSISNPTRISAFFKLVRWPNLLVIALTQFLLKYFVFNFFFTETGIEFTSTVLEFTALVFATVLVAAGGYIINDYFDVENDTINKPERVIVERIFSRQEALAMYYAFNILALLAGVYVAYRTSSLSMGLIFPAVAMLLWLYAADYKRSLILGNVIVAGLSSMVLLIVWLSGFYSLKLSPESFISARPVLPHITRFTMGYTVFAFLVSLARELIKDMEDAEGDREAGCRTFPVAYGLDASRKLFIGLIILVNVLLSLAVVWLELASYPLTAIGLGLFGMLPALSILFVAFRVKDRMGYARLSLSLKLLMLLGVLSMITIPLN